MSAVGNLVYILAYDWSFVLYDFIFFTGTLNSLFKIRYEWDMVDAECFHIAEPRKTFLTLTRYLVIYSFNNRLVQIRKDIIKCLFLGASSLKLN